MRKLRTLVGKFSLMKGLATAALAVTVFWTASFTSLAVQGTVTANTARIRKEASTESEVVGSTTKGKTIDILEAVKDGEGKVWYKVSISGGGYGYISSELVQSSENVQISENTGAAAAVAPQPADTVPTSIGEQQAVVKSTTNVRVRSGASTQHSTVTSLPNGTTVTLIGEANDSSGRKWYQMTCNYNGRNIEGYILSDLVAIGGGENNAEGGSEENAGEEGAGEESPQGEDYQEDPGEGEAPVQEPVPEHRDYEIVYAQNDAGEYDYYLYNYIEGNQQSLTQLLSYVDATRDNTDKLQKQVKNSKIIIIILAVVIVILFIILTILLFKLRDLYYDYEEEEEEEEEPVPVKKRAKKPAEEAPAMPRKKKPAVSQGEQRPVKTGERPKKQREEKELRAAEMREPAKKPAMRKPQNFLVDDDEFEFEFLNMDDKDL